ncbi:MAG: crotonobetainyl-CoA:carnitine CoA-transferase CaiB-like acyl-CoA transferase [Myxococcota bacterium]|jgi:crotonobetainyl-CoA:carnitine CoA-transferase CaiB-like acyl-CoA transferase
MPGPLDGIRVIDFSAVISGPLAAMMLADQGADVIKVEPPGRGDLLRNEWYRRGGLTSMFANVNRGKRSIVLDLQSDEGLEIAQDLVRGADVVIENFRPGVMDRLKLGGDAMLELNPQLIYCSISGYGATGPYSKRRAYDPVLQGMSGHVAIQKNPEVPIPDLIRNAVVDKAVSYTTAQAITAALFARERGAGGQKIAVPMLDVGLAFLFPDGMMKHTFMGDGVLEGPALYDRYRLTETSDGHVITWTGGDNEWHALFRALNRGELCDDPRFAAGGERAKHMEELGGILYDEFQKVTSAEILERMAQEDVPGGPVLSLDEVFEDPQILHNGIVTERDHVSAGRLRDCAPAARFSKTATEQQPIAPIKGEHCDEVLLELGLDAEQIAKLRAAGVVSGSKPDPNRKR